MAHSLMYGGPKVGANVAIATPKGYEPDATVVANAKGDAAAAGTTVLVTNSWKRPWPERTSSTRTCGPRWGRKRSRPRGEGLRRLDRDGPDDGGRGEGRGLHALPPCAPGEEVAAEVCDGPRSIIYDEAENRLHVQKAIMATLMG